jgi:hypothetical protein
MGVGFLHAGSRWGSCPTLPYGELRLWAVAYSGAVFLFL